jgi:hypothetical protein
MKSATLCESTAPGRYRLTRKAKIEGRLRSHRVECNNPAYGLAQLDEWELLERALAENVLRRKRSS